MGHCLMMRKGEVHTAPMTGVLASSLAVGSTVKLMEGGTAVEYLVVNQGIPENSSLYDASCDGTWLLRKDCHSIRQWNTSAVNTYANSAINSWLNGDFFNSLGIVEQTTAKQIKIPYGAGNKTSTVNSGVNGLSCKIFLLSGYEVGWTVSTYNELPVDGANVSCFGVGDTTTAKNTRKAYLNGAAISWWLRSPVISKTDYVWIVRNDGGINLFPTTNMQHSIRPALVLPGNALFDKSTKLLMGVK